MGLDLRLLRTFVVVARYEHVHEAARRLFLSQPTVSKHIRRLEEDLGAPLFLRVGKQIRLTPFGERFLPAAESLVEQAARTMEGVSAWQQGYRERLSIAASPIAARTFLPYVLRRYAHTYPHVEISVLVTESADIALAVGRREADIGLSRTTSRDPALRVKALDEDSVVMVAPAEGGDFDSPIESWEALLVRLPVISFNHPDYWEPLIAQLQHRGVVLRQLRVSQVDITVRFVQVGLGVSFLPRSSVQFAIEQNQVREVPAPDLELPTTATYLVVPASTPGPAAEKFIALLERVRLTPGFA